MYTDPIADMLTRIRNAGSALHEAVTIPLSKQKAAIAKVLKEEGYIQDYEEGEADGHPSLNIQLKYVERKPVIDGIQRISKPSCRVYVGIASIPRVRGGLGIAVMSTPEGVVSNRVAKSHNIGGEVLCYVW